MGIEARTKELLVKFKYRSSTDVPLRQSIALYNVEIGSSLKVETVKDAIPEYLILFQILLHPRLK